MPIAVHAAKPFGTSGQGAHVGPQVAGEVSRGHIPEHGCDPGLHVQVQPLDTHVLEDPGGPMHPTPHEPQFAVLVWVSTHAPPQLTRGDAQMAWHEPAEHTSPVAHDVPQPPQ